MEIERKWIVQNSTRLLEFLDNAYMYPINQFYTKITDDEEERYRSQYGKYIKTLKKGNGLNREEHETEIEKKEFMEKLHKNVGMHIFKIRYKVILLNYENLYDELALEFDFYVYPKFMNRVILEIEFKNENDAKKFEFKGSLKDIIGDVVEVTNDIRYKNKNIALNGFPV